MAEFLTHAEQSEIPQSKIVDYLLSPMHESGKAKANFFFRFGFKRDQWHVLADALRQHAIDYPVCNSVQTTRGVRYVIEGPINTPDGRRPNLRSVWFIETGEQHPRLVTAYPLSPTQDNPYNQIGKGEPDRDW